MLWNLRDLPKKCPTSSRATYNSHVTGIVVLDCYKTCEPALLFVSRCVQGCQRVHMCGYIYWSKAKMI